jgi:hypothetical protein
MDGLGHVVDYCVEHYFREANYLRIDGRPVFAVYLPTMFLTQLTETIGLGDPYAPTLNIDQLSNKEGLKRPLSRMNEEAQRHGLPGIYFVANIGCLPGNPYAVRWDLIPLMAEMGFEGVFAYNIVCTPAHADLPNDRQAIDYETLIEAHGYAWDQCEGRGLPHHPVVTLGCDVSPRWHRTVRWVDLRSFGYMPIVVNNTPESFGHLCRLALKHVNENASSPRMFFINAWNEWTEGMYLLPEKTYGTGYLEALRSALRQVRPNPK